MKKIWHTIARHQLQKIPQWSIKATAINLELPLCGTVRVVFVKWGKKRWQQRPFTPSARDQGGPWVVINCGAIPETLLESELFGHEKGAFTGAVSRQIGRFEQANHGTVFLDEIGELPLSLQVKILRFLQESSIERLGGSRTINLDIRIIAAANIDVEDAVKRGTFREDLFYRLNVVKLHLPDLKDRSEDILLLAHNFLLTEARGLGRGQVAFSLSALGAMVAHDWPGNVRELQNRVRGALASTTSRLINAGDLGFGEPAAEAAHKLPTLKEARDAAERAVVKKALAITGNNISQAAKLLDISRPTLHDLIKKHRLDRKL